MDFGLGGWKLALVISGRLGVASWKMTLVLHDFGSYVLIPEPVQLGDDKASGDRRLRLGRFSSRRWWGSSWIR